MPPDGQPSPSHQPSGPAPAVPSRGARRIIAMVQLWRREAHDPEPFYSALAEHTVTDLKRRHGSLDGCVLVDLGCGPGFYTRALRAAGSVVLPIDGDPEELRLDGSAPAGALVGDGGRLPLPDESLDGVFCSNLLEHTPSVEPVAAEIARTLKPGGWAYVSWTNWYSPWGGHEMSPWHLLGPRLGPRLYERRHGPPRKNRIGEGLFPVHIGPTLRLFREMPDLTVEQVEPRYWPRLRFICRIPLLRELITWNCVIRLAKAGPEALEAAPDEIEGWLTDDQARLLRQRASQLAHASTIVEIGSFRGRSTICLAESCPSGTTVVAVDPHAGTDRGPQEWVTTAEHGQSDFEAFHANLAAAGVDGKVRHVRAMSHEALDQVPSSVDLLFVDGAHRFGPARADIVGFGRRVAPGGHMLIHDSFSSVGVTLALVTTLLWSGRFRYVGRVGSLADYRREDLAPAARLVNAARQATSLPWFVRNLVVKALIVARLRPLTRLLGHRGDTWPH